MTHPNAQAAFPGLAESVLGPLLIGFAATAHDTDLIDEVWRVAAESVPTTMPVMNVREGKTTVGRKHKRKILTGTGTDYLKLAKLCDIRGDEPADESWKRGHWMVSAKLAPDDGTRQYLGPGRTCIRVDVTSYRLQAGQVLEAQQLALFRHYVVAGFQAIDPTVVVLGGQHDWQDNWWPVAQP